MLVDPNKHPSFCKLLFTHGFTDKITIPISFARWTGITYMKRMKLVNRKGKEWRVDIARKGRWVHIKGGWAEFRTHNKIASGDTCRFKFIQGYDGSNIGLQKSHEVKGMRYCII
ncbi:hypothetical protein RND71_034188 [Anisodus tanguticus]|uniref:TF-B3 domain-containing protein n=1 Tax=Anisodus tanguticus TaxID=243964 RepID=A0AAE1R937_9SOLA|nr:hypothetical protein RND71_034188 [Anisodus tanguticus]